jgi:hypothetical protein
VPDRAPGEEQIGQLLEGRAALGDGLELVAILLHLVEGLDQQAATDPLEVEAADAELVELAVGRRHLDDLEAALGAKDLERLGRVTRRDDGLEEARPDGACRRLVDDPVRADDPAVGGDAVALEREPERFGKVDDARQAATAGVLKSLAMLQAESRSSRLLKLRSLPAIWCAALMLPPAWAGSV